jgi:hypothetical protein
VTIAACLGVKDEIDLIRPAIAHLHRIGVTHIFASDANSTDGTETVLAELARQAGFDHLPFDDRGMDAAGEDALTADIMDRARHIRADWLIFVDADEFPLPRGGRLDTHPALAEADILVLERYNVVVRATGAALPLTDPMATPDEILLHVPAENRHAVTTRLRADPEAAWIMGQPAPKVMLRPNRVHSIAEGQHDAGADPSLRRLSPPDLFIAHLPFTTEGRFARKIANIRASVAASGDAWGPDSAWHWKRWLDNIDRRGGIAGEMARNLVTEDQLAVLRAEGLVRSAPDLWRQHPPSVPAPG